MPAPKKVVVIADKYISFQTKAQSFSSGLKSLGVSVSYLVSQETDFQPDLFEGADAAIYSGAWIHAKDMARIQKLTSVPIYPWIVSDAWVDAGYAQLLNQFDHTFSSSRFSLEILARDGVDRSKLSTLYEAVDTDFFQPDPDFSAKRELKAELGFSDDRPVLLTIGGDIISKGAPSVIRAIEAQKLWDKIHYVLLLNPKANNLLNQKLEQLKAEGIPTEELTILTELFEPTRVRQFYNLSDLYVAPCRFETFGRPLVEAMACGKPIVGLQAGSLTETNVDGQTGILVPVEDIVTSRAETRVDLFGETLTYRSDQPIPIHFYPNQEELGEALKLMLDQPEKREQMGQAARRRAVEHFSSKEIAAQFLEWLSAHHRDELGD